MVYSDHDVHIEIGEALKYVPVLELIAPASDAVAHLVTTLKNGVSWVPLPAFDKAVGEVSVIYRFLNAGGGGGVLTTAPTTVALFNVLQGMTMQLNTAVYNAGKTEASREHERWELEERAYAAERESRSLTSSMPMGY